MREVFLRTASIRLAQFLKWAGVAETGGQAHTLIADGTVRVNGVTEFRFGRRLFPGDQVCIDDGDCLMLVEDRGGG